MTTTRTPVARSLMGLLVVGLALLSGCSSPNEPPEVRITAPSEDELQGAQVSFEADAADPDGEITSYAWAFGDGGTSSEPDPTHAYDRTGEYRVELTVTDDSDETATDGITIRVQVGPQARASIHDPSHEDDVLLQYMSGMAPLDVAFDGSRSAADPNAPITAYRWDFGDGSSGTGTAVSHTYTEPGRHQATLTVTDSEGQTDQAEVVVEVNANEAAEGSVELDETVVSYRQAEPRSSTNSSRGRSLFYKYVVDAPDRLTEGEIETVLRDILELVRRQANADWINVQLYTAVRESFMAPRDYAHYLGALTWDGAEPEGDRVTVNANTAYLDDRATPVLGTKVEVEELGSDDAQCGELCERYRMAMVSLYVQDEPLCRGRLVNTVRDLGRWQLGSRFQGYLVTIYSRDIREQLGRAVGVRPQNGPDPSSIPLELFEAAPERWDLQEDTLWLQLNADVADCQTSSEEASSSGEGSRASP